MEEFRTPEGLQFKNPEEEIAYLKEELGRREQKFLHAPGAKDREHFVRDTVAAYQKVPNERVLAPSFNMPAEESKSIALQISPERHDTVMEELLGYIETKGIKNAMSVVERLGNPHVSDDFHRFLVQYLVSVGNISGLSSREPLYRALDMRLFQIALPRSSDNEKERVKTLKEMLSAMEQFYAGMMSVAGGDHPARGKNYFTIEIAIPHIGSEVVFYAATPSAHVDLFAKQIHAVFPDAKLEEAPDDYNIFNDDGASVGAYATPSRSPVFPLKTYDEFDHDPLNVILNVFTRIAEKGEGAVIQLVIAPAGDYFVKRYGYALEEIRKGVPVKHAVNIPESFGGEITKTVGEMFFGAGSAKKKNDQSVPEKPIDDVAIEQIKKKTSSTILNTNIRVITSAKTTDRARAILGDLESAFHQFGNTQGNSVEFHEEKGRSLLALFKEFSYRAWNDAESFPLNLAELTTILHFPVKETSSPILKSAKAGSAPAPLHTAKDGVILGVNRYHNNETVVRMGREDRVRHFYVIGQTGTGKTNILKNMIVQDIKNGEGVCFIDPHGSDVQDILSLIPRERADDVIYFDPAHTAHPMGLNMLEYDERFPEQKTFVVNEMMSIFNQLFDMKVGGGPMFEQYFRNAAALVMEDPASGSTLLEITRVLADKTFRDTKLSKCRNPIVIQFWASAEKTTGDQGLANFVPYVSSKFDNFISNDIMRPIVLQQRSAFNFRQIMDEKKILLVNLSKGRLGDINANLIGLVLVGKITMAALSRVDMFGSGKKPNDFYLYIDEFQNVTTPSIATILSEARKYRLSLNIAHQYIDQLSDEIKNAVFGNVGSLAVFRTGPEDAKFLESKFAPTFTAQDITKLDNYNAYINLLVNGEPTHPFNITTLPPENGDRVLAEKLKELSYLKYGAPRAEVEEEIMRRFRGDK